MTELTQMFTGKGTEPVFRGGDTKDQQNLNNIIIEAEKLRYSVYEKNRDWFLKNASIDPVFVLSDSARRAQMELISDFNKKWGKRAQETNYNFNEKDRMDMLTHKNYIIATAQQMQQEMDTFLQHRDLVAKNPNRYDVDKFALRADEYLKTGRYMDAMPPLKPLPPASAIREAAQKLKGTETEIINKSGQRVIMTTPFASEQDAEEFVQDFLLKNDQYMMGALEEWETLPDAEKQKWLGLADEDMDRVYTEGEQQNAILKWMRQRYAKEALTPQYAGIRNIPTAKQTTQGGFNKNLAVDVNNNLNNTYDKNPQRYKSFYFSDFYNLGGEAGPAKSQLIQDYINLNDGSKHALNASIPFIVVGYSADKDWVIIRPTRDVVDREGNYLYADDAGGSEIAVEGKYFDKFLKNDFKFSREASLGNKMIPDQAETNRNFVLKKKQTPWSRNG